MSAPRWDGLDDPTRLAACVAAAQRGDELALVALIEHCATRIRSAVFREGHGLLRHESEDAVELAISTIALKIDGYRGDAHLCTWMFSVATNTTRNEARKIRRRRIEEQRLLTRAPFELLGNVLGAERMSDVWIDQILAALPDEWRITFALFYIEGWSYDEIARQQMIAKGTVGGRLNRIRSIILRLMNQDDT